MCFTSKQNLKQKNKHKEQSLAASFPSHSGYPASPPSFLLAQHLPRWQKTRVINPFFIRLNADRTSLAFLD